MAPAGVSGGELTLAALIGVPALQAIQDAFASVFGLPTTIVNADGSPVTAITNRVAFCEDLTKTTTLGGERCAGCDKAAFVESAQSGAPAVFDCWNGMVDAAIPISPKGTTIGYFLCGQIYFEPPDIDRVRATAAEIGVDEDLYVEAAREIQVVPEGQYRASIQAMHVLAGMIADQAAAYIDNVQILEQSVAAQDDTRRLVDELDGILFALREIGLQPDHRATLHSIADNLETLIPHDSCVIYGLESDSLHPLVVRDPDPEPLWSFEPALGEGISGGVAVSRKPRRCDDVRNEPDFVAVPGLQSEPEAALVVPILDNDELFGVIALGRLQMQTFTDHELAVLDVFASQASVAIQRSQLQADGVRRLTEERALADLLRAMTRQTTIDETLSEICRCALNLLSATGVVVNLTAGGKSITSSEGLSSAQASALVERLESSIAAAAGTAKPEVVVVDHQLCLVAPLQSGRENLGSVILTRQESAAEWDLTLAGALASQAFLGISNRLMNDRETRAARRYQMLSVLTSGLVAAESEQAIMELLVTRLPPVVGADRCVVVLRDEGAEGLTVFQSAGRQVSREVVALSGSSRLATARLSAVGAAFDQWAQDTWRELDGQISLREWMVEPLVTATGVKGGIFVTWPERSPELADEDRHAIGVLGASASARLGAIEYQAETDDELRNRIYELQALTRLAQRLTGLDDRGSVIDELLGSFRSVAGLDCAAFCESVRSGGLVVRRELEVSPEMTATIEGELGLLADYSGPRLLPIGNGQKLVVLPLPGHHGGGLLAGVGPSARDPEGDPVLGALVRYGSVALERIRLQERQRRAISRLERENRDATVGHGRLERILELTRELTQALLNASGPEAVAVTVAEVLDARASLFDPDGVLLSGSSRGIEASWRPPAGKQPAETHIVGCAAGSLVGTPVIVNREIAAWVVVEFSEPVTPVEQAAVEHAAALAALDRVRERATQDVATRLRHGFLDELFSGEFVDELVLQRGLALGVDLRRASRVYLVQQVSGDQDQAPARELERAVADVARRHGEHIVAVIDQTVVAIVAEESLDPENADQVADPIEDRIRRAVAGLPAGSSVNIVAGTACQSPADYARSHNAARRGLDFLRLVGRSGENLSFRDQGVEQLLLRAGDPASLLEFVARYVEPLDLYDEGHSTELRHTLEVLYSNQGRLESSARELHIHVSTLRYRLERIELLIGVDPRVGEARLDLEVALRAAQMIPVHRDR